jgi:hypothetical protein
MFGYYKPHLTQTGKSMATRIKEVTFRRASMELIVEPETMRDYITFLQDEGETLGTLFGDDMEQVVSSVSTVPVATLEVSSEPAADTTTPRKTRKPRAGADPSTAVAPAPIPVPAAPIPPAALNTAPGANGIPAFLDRTAQAASLPPSAPVAQTPTPPAPPPLLPNSPAIVPNAPGGPVAQKVVKELERRASGSADGGKSLADWLAAYNVVNPGSSYADAIIAVATSVSDEKLVPVATALGV